MSLLIRPSVLGPGTKSHLPASRGRNKGHAEAEGLLGGLAPLLCCGSVVSLPAGSPGPCRDLISASGITGGEKPVLGQPSVLTQRAHLVACSLLRGKLGQRTQLRQTWPEVLE